MVVYPQEMLVSEAMLQGCETVTVGVSPKYSWF